MCKSCMTTSCSTHVGDLEVSPWLRPSLACSAGMVDSSYACPSWVASNGGSTLGDLWMWTSLLLVKSVTF